MVISYHLSTFTIFTKSVRIDIFILVFPAWGLCKKELLEFTHTIPSALEVPRKIVFSWGKF